jgi:hypothetical protein
VVSAYGYVLGNAVTSTGKSAAYMYRPESLTQAELLPFGSAGARVFASGALATAPYPIVVGQTATDPNGFAWEWARYVVRPPGDSGTLSTYPPPSSFRDGTILGTNYAGDMVGYYLAPGGNPEGMFSFGGAEVEPLAAFVHPAMTLGWDLQVASAINGKHQMVGHGTLNGHTEAFEIDPITETLVGLGRMSPTYDDLDYYATSINNAGVIVGTAGTAVDPTHIDPVRAFVYTNALHDLNEFAWLDDGWTLASAAAINDNNEIVGIARGPGNARVAYKLKLQGLLPAIPPLQCKGPVDGDQGWTLVHEMPAGCSDHE